MQKKWSVFKYALLLALWLPASSFCLIENAGLIPVNECCAGERENPVPLVQDSYCCLIASGNVLLSRSDVIAGGKLISDFCVLSSTDSAFLTVYVVDTVFINAIPPWTLSSLPFSLRLALPALAPPHLS